jgi:hypothetical protein
LKLSKYELFINPGASLTIADAGFPSFFTKENGRLILQFLKILYIYTTQFL